LKRSNRLIILIGLFLAVVAFVGVFLLLQGESGDGTGDGGTRRDLPTVFALKDIPLGVQVTADMIEQKDIPEDERAADAFNSTTLVVGKIARQDIVAGQQLTEQDFISGTGVTNIVVPPTKRAISVQVDQVTGVGTLIKAGDFVDAVVGFGAEQFPVVTINPNDDSITPVAGVNGTSVKLLLQGMQALGVLLPPPPAEEGGEAPPAEGEVNLTGQQEIVILAVTAQQAEVMKFAQLQGSISLVLRSLKDFEDPANPGQLVEPIPDVTTGIILKTLVDEYGVLVPELIETVLPEEANP
jgi:pilus assembly protein CpaB